MLYLYTLTEAIVAVVAGITIAVRTKKAEHVTYGKLDRAGQITNVLLLLVYLCLAPLYLFLGVISNPAYDGFLGFIGWVVSGIMASASLFCGLGLGFSVAFRKRGKSKLSFLVQFAGVFSIGLTIIMYYVFTGNLLRYLN